MSNLLYLHASNQPLLLGPYSSNTTPLPHVTPSIDIPPLHIAHISTNHPGLPSLPTAHTSADQPGTDHTLHFLLPNAPVPLPLSSNDPSPLLPPTLPTVTMSN